MKTTFIMTLCKNKKNAREKESPSQKETRQKQIMA